MQPPTPAETCGSARLRHNNTGKEGRRGSGSGGRMCEEHSDHRCNSVERCSHFIITDVDPQAYAEVFKVSGCQSLVMRFLDGKQLIIYSRNKMRLFH